MEVSTCKQCKFLVEDEVDCPNCENEKRRKNFRNEIKISNEIKNDIRQYSFDYILEEPSEIKIHDECLDTYPCDHRVTFTYCDGFEYDFGMNGFQIFSMLKNKDIMDGHFLKYKILENYRIHH